MDTHTYQTQRTVSLGLSFSRRWPWLSWRLSVEEIPDEYLVSQNRGIFITYCGRLQRVPKLVSPTALPSTSLDTATQHGCAASVGSIVGDSLVQALGEIARAQTAIPTQLSQKKQ